MIATNQDLLVYSTGYLKKKITVLSSQYVKFSLELSGKRVGEMQTLQLETFRSGFINGWIMNV